MKKAIYSLGILAFAAFSFASCQKELAPADEQEGKLVTVTFVAESVNTKSGIAEEGSTTVSYKWTDGDQSNVRLYTVSGNTVEGVTIDSFDFSESKLTFTADVEQGSTVRAMVSKATTNSGWPKLMNTQSPKVDSFDPDADILFSEDADIQETTTGLVFNRMVTVNKMTLYGLHEGEKIRKVILNSDKHLTGYWDKDGSVTGDQKTITFNYENVDAQLSGEDYVFPVYFTSIPQESQTLSIEVQTNQYTYSKTLSTTVSFILGQFTKFKVGLPDGTPTTSFVPGNYVIGNKEGDKIAVCWTEGNNLKTLSVTPLDGNLLYAPDADINKSVFTISESTDDDYQDLFTIKDGNEKYLYAASSSANHLKAKEVLDKDCYWDISKNADGSFSVIASKSSNRNVMQFNSSSSVFSCYSTASQEPVVLYLASSLIANSQHSITVTQPSVGGEISVSPTGAQLAGTEITLTATPSNGYLFEAWDVKDASNNVVAVSDNKFTMPISNVTVTASFVEDATNPLGAGTWNDPYNAAKAVQIASELANNSTTQSAVYVTGTVTEIIELSTSYHNATYIISSGNATIEVYRGKNFNGTDFTSTDQLAINDVVTVYGKLKKYVSGDNITLEVDQNNYLFARNGEIHLVAPVIEATGNNTDKTIQVSWSSVAGATSYYVTCGSKSATETGTSHTFTMDDYGTYEVQVKAKGATGVVDGVSESKSVTLTNPSSGDKINQVLFHESFGSNAGSARTWSDSYSVKSGIPGVYSGVNSYTVSNVKQGKNTTGSTLSGLNQSTKGTDAYIIIGPLNVAAADNMILTYQWNAASIKGTYSTSLYYKTSSSGSYTEVTGAGDGATTFVERSYALPDAAKVNTLYLKIVWNTSNAQAIIDEVNLQGDY